MKTEKVGGKLTGKKPAAFLPALLQDYFEMCMRAAPGWDWKKKGGIHVQVSITRDNQYWVDIGINFTLPSELGIAIRSMPEGVGRMDITKFEATHGFMCRGQQALTMFNEDYTCLDGSIRSEGQEFIPAKHRKKLELVAGLRKTFTSHRHTLLDLRQKRSGAKRALGVLAELVESTRLNAIGQAYMKRLERKIRAQERKCNSCVQKIRLADCEGSMLRIIGFSRELGEWLEERQSNITITYKAISENGDPRYRFRTPKVRKLGVKSIWVS